MGSYRRYPQTHPAMKGLTMRWWYGASALVVAMVCAIAVWWTCQPRQLSTVEDAVYFGFVTKGSIVTKTIALREPSQEGEVLCWSDCEYVRTFLRRGGRVEMTVVLDTRRVEEGELHCNVYLASNRRDTRTVCLPLIGIVQSAHKKSCCRD